MTGHVYIPPWPEALYSITVSMFSRRNLLVAFGLPLLSPSLSFYCLASKLIFRCLITPPLLLQLPLPCSLSATYLRTFQKLQYWPNYPLVFQQTACQNSRTFDVVLPGVSPPFSGLPSGISEVLRCSSVESINRGLLSISCM